MTELASSAVVESVAGPRRRRRCCRRTRLDAGAGCKPPAPSGSLHTSLGAAEQVREHVQLGVAGMHRCASRAAVKCGIHYNTE